MSGAQTWQQGFLVPYWRAGLDVDVDVRVGYEDRPPAGDDDLVVFVARKPECR